MRVHSLSFMQCTVYSFDDVSGDTSLKHFDINKAPSSVFSVLKDILSINSAIKVHLLPWSPVCSLLCYGS